MRKKWIASLVLILFTGWVYAQTPTPDAKQGNNIYALLTPIAIFFVLVEIGVELVKKKGRISFQEAVANMGTALGNQTVNVLVAAGVYITYGYLWNNFRLFTIPMNWVNGIFLLISMDFIFYWVHRWGHKINILWAAHSPHHSAEEMNFFVALRASVTQRLVSFLFFWPLTIIGFEPMDIYVMSALHLFISFLHHTEYIGKLGPIEWIFTTPSHHRVHHGMNFRYLDKNYGEFLIIWDRLFGSFAEEKEKIVYGMYNGPNTWNPILINFHYYILLWKDAMAAPNWWDKIRIWFMPTGWRPRGLPQKQLQEVNAENQIRFVTPMYQGAKPYLIFQVIFGLYFVLLIIQENTPWNTMERWVGAGLLWWMIINWSGIMEHKKWVLNSETLRIITTSVLFIRFHEWNIISIEGFLSITFFTACLGWTLYFFRPNAPSVIPKIVHP
ncbi:MAG: sterol desaturase family protein [Flavobacteriales bacterium]|nr:sterol desaturase family protein [Flavobacteriales bacterium]